MYPELYLTEYRNRERQLELDAEHRRAAAERAPQPHPTHRKRRLNLRRALHHR